MKCLCARSCRWSFARISSTFFGRSSSSFVEPLTFSACSVIADSNRAPRHRAQLERLYLNDVGAPAIPYQIWPQDMQIHWRRQFFLACIPLPGFHHKPIHGVTRISWLPWSTLVPCKSMMSEMSRFIKQGGYVRPKQHTIIRGGGGSRAEEGRPHRSNLFSSIGIECYTRLKPGTRPPEQGLLVSKSFRKILPMFVCTICGRLRDHERQTMPRPDV